MEECTWTLGALTLRGIRCPASGKPRGDILALHGWLDNAASFLPLSRCLPDHNWILLDLPGHGLSDWLPPGLIYHFIDGVAHICELLRLHLAHPVTLLGHSMGAGLAPLVAVGVPDLVERLILLDGLGPLTSPAREAPRLLQTALQAMSKSSQARIYESRAEVAEAIAKSRDLTVEQAEPLLERGARPDNGTGWRVGHDPRLKLPSRQRLTEGQAVAMLETVHQPTLVIAPDQGLFLRHPQWQARKAKMAHCHVETTPGGHHVHLENPQRIADLIRRWWP